MKKTAENRYPHSAALFRFCKEALEIRYEGNVKVIDQDVGAILGYDPADCSHWKKGKKNIRALSTLRSIADHLSIDERILIDIASGKIGLEEAVFEFRGYGQFSISGRNLENLKKEFFRNPTRWQNNNGLKSFEELFSIDRAGVVQVANEVLQRGKFSEAPIYIPEVYALFPDIQLIAEQNLGAVVTSETNQETPGTGTCVKFQGPEMRPYIRFMLARELWKHFVTTKNSIVAKFFESPPEVIDVQANIFAGALLIPGKLLRKEVEKIDSSMDIVLQLAEVFWTSKALMNQRLRDYMEHIS